MIHKLLITNFLLLIASACSPSTTTPTPIVTTTVLPDNSTTTTIPTNATTTSPIPTSTSLVNTTTALMISTTSVSSTTPTSTTTTTVAPMCCPYPTWDGVNTAVPVYTQWNQCNQTVTLTCEVTGPGILETGIYYYNGSIPTTAVPTSGVMGGGERITNTLTCNTAAMLWYSGTNTGHLFGQVVCVYKQPDGTWLPNNPQT